MNVLDLDSVRAAARAPSLTGRFSAGKLVLSLEVPSLAGEDGRGDAAARFQAAVAAAEALGFRRGSCFEAGWIDSLHLGNATLRLRYAPTRRPTR